MTSGAKNAVVIAFAIVVVAGVSGLVSRKDAPVDEGQAISGDALLTYPADWRPVSAATPITGLRLADPIMLAPRGSARSAGLVAGRIPGAPGPTGLPSRFVDTLEHPPESEAVWFGGVEAFRYAGLQQQGSTSALTLYLVPAATSTLAIACVSPLRAPSGFAQDCERVAASVLRTDAPAPSDLRPDRAYARRIDRAVVRLSRTRTIERTNLRHRGTSDGQAAVAKRLSRAYARAAGRIGRAGPPEIAVGTNTTIADALKRTARAYADLAIAADRHRGPAYARTRRRVLRAEAEVQRALRALAALGYHNRADNSVER